MFRYVQILTAMLNEIQKNSLVLMFVVAPIFIGSFALVTFIKGSNTDVIFVAALLVIMMDCFLAILCIQGQMASVYTKSRSIIENLSWKQSRGETKFSLMLEHRFYKSCLPLKIMMGSDNFIESLTPLNCLEHSLNLSVNV